MKKATAAKTKTTPPVAPPVAEKKPGAAKPKAPAKSKTASPAFAAAPAVAPEVKAAAPVLTTTIQAIIDVGFGNSLTIRGEGPGLSWEKGTPLDCVADDQWAITITGASAPIVFKFLVNDLSWSTGEDYVVQPGSKLTVTPTF